MLPPDGGICSAATGRRPANRMSLVMVLSFYCDVRSEYGTETTTLGGGVGWRALELPPWSPDLNPCDYNLIPRSMQILQGEQSENGEDVLTAARRLMARISAFGNADGVDRLRRRWRRTMGNLGDYSEGSSEFGRVVMSCLSHVCCVRHSKAMVP
jgi:hypothetical protein